MDVNIATISYLRVLIIGIGSTIILMVVEAQGIWCQVIKVAKAGFNEYLSQQSFTQRILRGCSTHMYLLAKDQWFGVDGLLF